MEYLTYLLATLIGVSLSLFGSGGSILALPILVYGAHVPMSLATTYSFAVVGVTSLISMILSRKSINYQVVTLFGAPSFLGIYIARSVLIPLIPDTIQVFNLKVAFDSILLVAFALSMLVAATSLIRESRHEHIQRKHTIEPLKLVLYGLLVGMFTGFLGAGGGFLIVPALLYFANISISEAIATSVTLVALNTLFAFAVSSTHTYTIDWMFLGFFIAASLLGMFSSARYKSYIGDRNLKKYFGWFIACVGLSMMILEMSA